MGAKIGAQRLGQRLDRRLDHRSMRGESPRAVVAGSAMTSASDDSPHAHRCLIARASLP